VHPLRSIAGLKSEYEPRLLTAVPVPVSGAMTPRSMMSKRLSAWTS
jgi:hypothetical protein